VVLLVLVLEALLLGFHYVKQMILRFTDTQPMPLPAPQVSQAEMAQVKERFESFEQAVRECRAATPLTDPG
jgi:hypothetical protein